MKSLKKYLNLILLGAAFLFIVLIFVAMTGDAFVITLKPVVQITSSATLYEVLKAEEGNGIVITAFVFTIIGLVLTLGLIFLKLAAKKFKYENIVCFVAALIMFVTAILFFLTLNQIDPKVLEIAKDNIKLGVGAILSGIFSLASAGLLGFAILKK